jgi:hypothetical protein
MGRILEPCPPARVIGAANCVWHGRLGPLRCRARGHLKSTRKDKPEEVVSCSRAQRSLRLAQTREPPQVNFVEARTATNEEF